MCVGTAFAALGHRTKKLTVTLKPNDVSFRSMNVSSPFPNDTGIILQGEMVVCYFAQNSLSLFLCLHEVQWDFVVVCLIPGPLFESNDPDSLPRSKDFKTSLWSGRANHTPGQWSERHTLRRWHWCPVVGGMQCPMTDWWHVWVAWEQ